MKKIVFLLTFLLVFAFTPNLEAWGFDYAKFGISKAEHDSIIYTVTSNLRRILVYKPFVSDWDWGSGELTIGVLKDGTINHTSVSNFTDQSAYVQYVFKEVKKMKLRPLNNMIGHDYLICTKYSYDPQKEKFTLHEVKMCGVYLDYSKATKQEIDNYTSRVIR